MFRLVFFLLTINFSYANIPLLIANLILLVFCLLPRPHTRQRLLSKRHLANSTTSMRCIFDLAAKDSSQLKF